MRGMAEEMELKRAAATLASASRVVALTGAGISVDSGIPDFRSAGGLWSKYNPAEYASIQAFKENPAKVWRMFRDLGELVNGAEPNPAHLALARLEELGRLKAVITQNVDGLHRAAGSREVIEFHGSGGVLKCLDCGRDYEWEAISLESLPPLCACGGPLKPDVVLFGEPMPEKPLHAALAQAAICQVMLVVATSAMVAPASHLPMVAKQGGAKVIEINLEPTPLSGVISDHVLMGGASQLLPRLVREVEALMESSLS